MMFNVYYFSFNLYSNIIRLWLALSFSYEKYDEYFMFKWSLISYSIMMLGNYVVSSLNISDQCVSVFYLYAEFSL